jgi:hypothetical protein
MGDLAAIEADRTAARSGAATDQVQERRLACTVWSNDYVYLIAIKIEGQVVHAAAVERDSQSLHGEQEVVFRLHGWLLLDRRYGRMRALDRCDGRAATAACSRKQPIHPGINLAAIRTGQSVRKRYDDQDEQ